MPIFLTVTIGLWLVLALGGEPTPPLFVEDLREHSVTIAAKGGTYQGLLVRVSGLDRVELVETTDEALTAIDEAVAFVEATDVDPAVAGPLAVFGEAASSWSSGLTGFRDHLLRAADDPAALGLEEALTDALLDLRAGDRLYAAFVEAIGQSGMRGPVSGFPEAAFLPGDYPFTSAAGQLVQVARAPGSNLKLRPALAIDQVTTEPELLLDTDDRLVVTQTDSLVVKVVVVNAGNARSEPAEVSLQLVGGEEDLLSDVTTEFDALDPNTKTTVTFEPLEVVPGSAYQLVVRLPLAPGEVESSDNLWARPFRVNEETTPTTVS